MIACDETGRNISGLMGSSPLSTAGERGLFNLIA